MKAAEIHTPSTSWLHGKYPEIYAEINTRLPYVSLLDGEYFWRGDEADQVIQEIHKIWLSGGTVPEAITKYQSLYL